MAAAARARGWGPPRVPLLLLLLPAACEAAQGLPAAARLSLHPPYFNLAEAARIWATATCGEPAPGSARPEPELYCKLVGGPTAPGRGHAIQVGSRERARGPGPSPRGSAQGAKESGPFPARASDPRRQGGAPSAPARADDPGTGARCPASPLPARGPGRGWVKHAGRKKADLRCGRAQEKVRSRSLGMQGTVVQGGLCLSPGSSGPGFESTGLHGRASSRGLRPSYLIPGRSW